MALRLPAGLLALMPAMAAASTTSQSSAYNVGYQVGRAVAIYGPYACAAALVGLAAWLWYRRTRSRAIQR